MSSSSLTLFFFFFFASSFLYTSSNSFNITNILKEHDDFSTFNALLSQTQLASTINNRQTITVLAVSNNALSSLSGTNDVIKKILSLHIVLDYYDMKKLKNLNKKSVRLTTLFQSSGQARGQQGFLNTTVMKNGDVAFGSAVPGSSLNAQLVDSVMSQPFNISVLHISSAIMIDVKADAPTSSSSPVSSPPKPAESPNGEDSDYDHHESPSSAPGAANSPSEKAGSANGVSMISSQVALVFALVMSSFWWFMTV